MSGTTRANGTTGRCRRPGGGYTRHVDAARPSDGTLLATRVGERVRGARHRAGLTQSQLAGGRYTKAYISALENGLVRPSLPAITFLAEQLQVSVASLLDEAREGWRRVDADLQLASGAWDEARLRYEAILEDADDRARPEVLRGLAEALCRLERGAEAVRAGAEAATLFGRQGRAVDSAHAEYWVAYGQYLMGNASEAGDLLRDLRRRLREADPTDPDLETRVVVAMAAVASRDGRPEAALGLLEEARAASERLDERRRAAYLMSLAMSYRDLGDHEAAISAGIRSLGHFEAVAAERETASIHNELALAYLRAGSLALAASHAGEAHGRFARLGDERSLADVLETRAEVALAGDDPAGALDLADDAAARGAASRNVKAELTAHLTRGRALRRLERADEARTVLAAAVEQARAAARPQQLRELLAELSEVVAELGDLPAAFALSREALSVPAA